MVPKGAIVQADDARNILALKGSPAEIESMLDSISVFDVDVMKGMSFAVVPVKTPQPEKMVDELKAIFAAEKEGPLKGRVRFIANTRLGAILVVTSQPSYLPRAQTWIRRLDAKAAGSERQLHVYQVQNRPVAELASVLQSMFANEMKVVKPPTRSVSPRSKQASFSGSSAKSPGPGGATPDIDQGGSDRASRRQPRQRSAKPATRTEQRAGSIGAGFDGAIFVVFVVQRGGRRTAAQDRGRRNEELAPHHGQ